MVTEIVFKKGKIEMIAMSAPNDDILRKRLNLAINLLSGIQQTMGVDAEEIKQEWEVNYPIIKELATTIYNSLVLDADQIGYRNRKAKNKK